MTTVKAYAAKKASAPLEPFEYTLPSIKPYEVDIAVESCGICHSDLSMIDNAWEASQFPLVPGHEIIGKVITKGDLVSHLLVGERVGVGWQAGYCMLCDQCLAGDHNLCRKVESTLIGRHGGFATIVRAHGASALPLPPHLNVKKAAPLLCAGVTVFNSLIQHHVLPTSCIGVIGIGGLGHLALKFAHAWGCHVTALTSSDSKEEEALSFGAHEVINSRNPDAIKSATSRFDLLISTVNIDLDWNSYLATLKPKGKLHMLGVVLNPLNLNLLPMLAHQLSVSSSPVGSPATILNMLDFAARHHILPMTEHFPLSKVNDALEHLRSGKARYRIILDHT